MNPSIVSSVSKTLAEMTVFPNWSDVANLAYWVTSTEGSNPSLSAKIKGFLSQNIRLRPLSKILRWTGWGQSAFCDPRQFVLPGMERSRPHLIAVLSGLGATVAVGSPDRGSLIEISKLGEE
jgi:hypothetical protein